ncbi:MAG: phosphatidylserine decarboxylase family protein [Gemmatimonadota bacterium]
MIAREGLPFIAIGATLTATVAVFALGRRSVVLWALTVVFALLTVWVCWFFRDPERSGERGEDVVISPADGRVVMITEVDEPAFMGGRARRISIFMNVLNVHVNRYPVSGTVRYRHYNRGKFLNAAGDKASLDNEQMSTGIELRDGSRVLVRQIAGLIARRIVTYARDGEEVAQGKRMGLIRFGSRVDVFISPEDTVTVRTGDVTAAGTTVVARRRGGGG